jgi:TonB family protein
MGKNRRPHTIEGALWAVETEEERKTFLSFPYSFCAASLLFGVAAWTFIFVGMRPDPYEKTKQKPMQIVLLQPPAPPPAPLATVTPPTREPAIKPPPIKTKPDRQLKHQRRRPEPPSPLPQSKEVEIVKEAPAPQVEQPSEKTDSTDGSFESKAAISTPMEIGPSVPTVRARSKDGTGVRSGVVPVYKEECTYPREAISQGIRNGEVTALLNVDENGNVAKVQITKANPLRVFDREVKRCVSKWKFRADGQAYMVDAPLSFKFEDK